MYSNWSESSQRQPHGDRRWRQRDRDDRRQYEGERRRSREYSASPPRPYGRDSASRWSPVRRRASSPSPEGTRRRVAEDDGSEYRYRAEPWDQSYSRRPPPPPDVYGRTHDDPTEAAPQKNDFTYRDSPELARRYRQEDARRDDAGAYRRSHGDRGGRRRSWERSRSRERPTKSYGGGGERAGSPPASSGQEERRLHAAEFPVNGSCEQMHASRRSHDGDAAAQRGAVKPEQKPAEGFRRFLDILNKGVNMDTLSRIVAQTPAPGGEQHGFARDPAGRRSRSREKERGERHGLAPPPRRQSLSPKDVESESKSPPAAAMAPTPEDEHKRRQMQDVLQAIGLDLGLDELGQMSHRIQERLYGRRAGEPGARRRSEKAARAPPPRSPKRRSRSSSSSSSSVSPERCRRQDSSGADTDESERRLGRHSPEDAEFDSERQEAAAAAGAAQLSPPAAMYAPPGPPPTLAMPPYSPVSCSPLPYPPPPLAFPHAPPAPFTPHHPPPPPAHFQHMPPPSAFPPRLPFPPPFMNQLQSLNAAKAEPRAEPRQRCLKVIETKPG